MSSAMTVSQARAALPAIIERVQAGDEVTLTRHGIPVAVILRPDAVRARRAEAAFARAEEVAQLLQKGRSRPLARRGSLSEAQGAELLAEVEASRRHR